jgi:hypothetical protein
MGKENQRIKDDVIARSKTTGPIARNPFKKHDRSGTGTTMFNGNVTGASSFIASQIIENRHRKTLLTVRHRGDSGPFLEAEFPSSGRL